MKKIISRLPESFVREAKYYLTIGSITFAGLLVMQIARWINAQNIEQTSDGIVWFTAPSLYFLSLPIAFLFWIYALRDVHRFTLSFSLPACIASVIGFMLASGLDLKEHHALVIIFSLLGCLAGCFTFISWQAFRHYAFRDERMTCVAIIGMFASGMYCVMDSYMWERMAYSAALSSKFVLELLGLDMDIGVYKRIKLYPATVLSSDNFTIMVYQPCSGLEGIFLFIFLLSLVLLLDWKMFLNLRLIETYLIGFIFMYVANILRIVSLFTLGHNANAPDASPLMASMKGLPMHIFHSFVGQLYYILAFMVFTHVLYAYVALGKKPDTALQ